MTATRHNSKVFVRVRPQVFDGGGHDQSKPGVAKCLAGWTDTSVHINSDYMFSDDNEVYSFPTKVFGDDATQEDVFEQFAPAGEEFSKFGGKNVLLMNYGQTGCGKTHTTFGTDVSLTSRTPHKGWGYMPRLMRKLYVDLEENIDIRFHLQVYSVEFYEMGVFDLLGDRNALSLGRDFKPMNAKHFDAPNFSTFMDLFQTILKRRQTRSTKMNTAKEDHAGSSRSHCAICLKLWQYSKAQNSVSETLMEIVDLAGAERPSKTGEARLSSYDVMVAMVSGKPLPTGAQGILINYELFEFGSQCVICHDAKKKSKGKTPYKVPQQLGSPFMQFLSSSACNDKSLLYVITCVSQAPSNGWETWFSMQYGNNCSKVINYVSPAAVKKLPGALKEAIEQEKKYAALIQTAPTSKSQKKYFPARQNDHFLAAEKCRIYQSFQSGEK